MLLCTVELTLNSCALYRGLSSGYRGLGAPGAIAVSGLSESATRFDLFVRVARFATVPVAPAAVLPVNKTPTRQSNCTYENKK